MKYVKIEFEDESQYEGLKETKKRHGLTWRGMLLHAQKELDSGSAD
ncbi:hypothetical protein HLRTI_001550 [Halorhabdus tiamatea SARL4B]|uniref:Uncharacterized protein n=1 Tax=Halorhabdus tiamatea SARL4B TaxID=1033806 RepID=F7PM47_9EURY|nr:hypothetical protein [Halorhabdus tiamatea]ERJ06345.1 hypothetical protein HLRTI_001550 [Halorhabdus tiamatea SARL4B]CCQ34513.1 hypothetical protein HTIA_2405 [Halorhabdus tiamatea SARL4B]